MFSTRNVHKISWQIMKHPVSMSVFMISISVTMIAIENFQCSKDGCAIRNTKLRNPIWVDEKVKNEVLRFSCWIALKFKFWYFPRISFFGFSPNCVSSAARQLPVSSVLQTQIVYVDVLLMSHHVTKIYRTQPWSSYSCISKMRQMEVILPS